MPAPDLSDFLDRYEPPVEEVPICGRAGLVADHAAAEAAVLASRANSGLGGVPSELMERLSELEAEIERSVLVFKVRGVSQRVWADLLRNHPPGPEEVKRGLRYSPDSFDLAALALSAIEPTVTVEDADRLRNTLPPSEWGRLVLAVLSVNQEATSPPKSLLLSALRHLSDGSSTTQPSEGSLGEPSSDASGEQ